MTPKKHSKIIKTALSATWWAVLILLAVLLVTIFAAKLRGEVPKVFGYSVMNIVSGSMSPEIEVGDYILVRSCDPEDIREGDIISFYSSDPAIFGMPNTHRVAAPPIITDEGIEFVTRGDANAVNDTYNAKGEDLIGKYVGDLPALGAFSDFLGGNAMFVIFIVIQAVTVGIFFYSYFKKDGEKEEKTEELSPEDEERIKREAISEYLASVSDTAGDDDT